jgi:hypothetical protein
MCERRYIVNVYSICITDVPIGCFFNQSIRFIMSLFQCLLSREHAKFASEQARKLLNRLARQGYMACCVLYCLFPDC